MEIYDGTTNENTNAEKTPLGIRLVESVMSYPEAP